MVLMRTRELLLQVCSLRERQRATYLRNEEPSCVGVHEEDSKYTLNHWLLTFDTSSRLERVDQA